jgi:phosphoglycerol transferase MdoB-like AlkP superfamily enzyme
LLKQATLSLLRRLSAIAVVFLVVQFLVRATLAWRAGREVVDGPADAIRPFLLGTWFDLVVVAGGAVPFVLYWLLLPKNWRGGQFDTAMSFGAFVVLAFVVGFTAIGEHLFWTEFGARFNFIAIDYLVYTHEVIGNIRESYPVVPLLAALMAAVLLLTWWLRRSIRPARDGLPIRARAPVAAAALAGAAVLIVATNLSWSERSTNALANELSANGHYTLLHAFGHNEISYARFYHTEDEALVGRRMRAMLAGGKARIGNPDLNDITHDVVYPGPALRKNVIVVMMESMGSEFMGQFNKGGLTPNLDRLANEGVFFSNLLATGTRTVRGLEAITLALPPTPGQSIVRRPRNDDLFSLGAVLRDRGYDTAFIYGGFGLFDNMNNFYASNGYRTVDRATMTSAEISFANVWGVADEDLFARVVREADAAHAAGRPFLFQVMTTSNHRPYTYPEGRIDIPSGSGRPGAVKYADYAVGKLIEDARRRSWFKDTLFVFVADHTAGAAGKIELDPTRYQIPAIFYAPEFVQPARIDRLVSQIDIAPSILGLLNVSYRSRFLGEDQIRGPYGAPRAFISNFQKIAMVRDDRIVILGPKREVKFYVFGRLAGGANVDPALLRDAVAYYQFASHWSERFKRVDSRIEDARPADVSAVESHLDSRGLAR